jgi:hypothetical protein
VSRRFKALIKKAGLMYEETTSPEPQGFEKSSRAAEALGGGAFADSAAARG